MVYKKIYALLYNFKPARVNLCRYLAIGQSNRCFVELAAKSVSAAQLQAIEGKCNEAIRSQIPMTPHWYQPGTPELEQVRDV